VAGPLAKFLLVRDVVDFAGELSHGELDVVRSDIPYFACGVFVNGEGAVSNVCAN